MLTKLVTMSARTCLSRTARQSKYLVSTCRPFLTSLGMPSLSIPSMPDVMSIFNASKAPLPTVPLVDLPLPDSDADAHLKDVPCDVVFCGNPGTGKSTLLSGVSGLQFQSGVSWGEGLTSKLEMQTSPDQPTCRYGDTPGLADIGMAEKAASAITQALKESAGTERTMKLFFVVTVEAGRIRTQDLFTIKQVLSSIRLPDGKVPGPNAYGIIFNKCSFLDQPEFASIGRLKLAASVGTRSKSVPYPTQHGIFLPLVAELNDATCKVADFHGLRDFVARLPGLQCMEEPAAIDVSSIEDQLAAAAQQQKADFDKLEQALKEGHQQQMQALKEEIQMNQQELQQKMKQLESMEGLAGDMKSLKEEHSKEVRMLREQQRGLQRKLDEATESYLTKVRRMIGF